jgi:hypothetical protein
MADSVRASMLPVLGACALAGAGAVATALLARTFLDTSTSLPLLDGFALATGWLGPVSPAARPDAATIAGSVASATPSCRAALGFAATGGWTAQAPSPANVAANRTRPVPVIRRALPGGLRLSNAMRSISGCSDPGQSQPRGNAVAVICDFSRALAYAWRETGPRSAATLSPH